MGFETISEPMVHFLPMWFLEIGNRNIFKLHPLLKYTSTPNVVFSTIRKISCYSTANENDHSNIWFHFLGALAIYMRIFLYMARNTQKWLEDWNDKKYLRRWKLSSDRILPSISTLKGVWFFEKNLRWLYHWSSTQVCIIRCNKLYF